jgi:hypothetical protein
LGANRAEVIAEEDVVVVLVEAVAIVAEVTAAEVTAAEVIMGVVIVAVLVEVAEVEVNGEVVVVSEDIVADPPPAPIDSTEAAPRLTLTRPWPAESRSRG